jgi:hypothetical protein
MRRAFTAGSALLVLVVVGCSWGGGEAGQLDSRVEAEHRLDPARLRELELTRRIPTPVREACSEARRAATARVLCPKLIPDVPLSKIEGLAGGPMVLLEERRFYELDFTNAGGFDNRPLQGVQHWIVGAGKADVVQKWVLTDFANEVKGDPKLAREVTAAGRRVRVYRFPRYPAGGGNGSHWAAFVRVGDELVFASLHGKRYVDGAVEMALDLAAQATRSPLEPAGFPVAVHDFTITYCGSLSVSLNGELWLADPPRTDRSATTSPRWRETEEGTFLILSRERARFRTRSGEVTSFVRAKPGAPDPPERCG